jgi:hypothetical protein
MKWASVERMQQKSGNCKVRRVKGKDEAARLIP